MSTTEVEYTPEIVEHDLRHWTELRTAAEGGTGAQWDGPGRRKGTPQGLVCVVADLEHAADKLPISWTVTHAVYVMQGRLKAWQSRVQQAGGLGVIAMRHETPGRAFDHMARTLGWTE